MHAVCLTHSFMSFPRPFSGYRVHPIPLQHWRLHLLQSPPARRARTPVSLRHQPHFPALHQVLPEGDLPPGTQVLPLLPHLSGFQGGQGEKRWHSVSRTSALTVPFVLCAIFYSCLAQWTWIIAWLWISGARLSLALPRQGRFRVWISETITTNVISRRISWLFHLDKTDTENYATVLRGTWKSNHFLWCVREKPKWSYRVLQAKSIWVMNPWEEAAQSRETDVWSQHSNKRCNHHMKGMGKK